MSMELPNDNGQPKNLFSFTEFDSAQPFLSIYKFEMVYGI